jgi:surface protein
MTPNIYQQYNITSTVTPFISTWNTSNVTAGSSTNVRVKLPLVSTGTYNFVVDWGDSTTDTITAYNQAAVTHTYATSSVYQIKIKGVCNGWQFNNGGDRSKILSVQQWGTSLIFGTTQSSYFYGCNNLNLSSVTDTPVFTGVLNMSNCFNTCTSLTSINKIGEWASSEVTDMSQMFINAYNFNQDISGMDTSNVTNMSNMFNSAINFNGGLASGATGGTMSLNTSNVTNMTNMFSLATAFNQYIGSWDTSKVINMTQMFFHNVTNKFNNGFAPGVSGTMSWNTSNVTNMSNVFYGCAVFNQYIGSWDTSKVTTMSQMFGGASLFNQDVGSWVTTNVTIMNSVFYNATSFNKNLSSWDTSNATTTSNMFGSATNFNNGLAPGVSGTMSWNTSNVTDMSLTFYRCPSFNQNVGSWDTSKVTSIAYMFQESYNFNQNLNSWNTTNVSSMVNLFSSASKFNNGLAPGVGGTLSWNITNKVTSLFNVFDQASAFNQNIDSWDISNVTTMNRFLYHSSFNNGLASGATGSLSWNTSKVTDMSYSLASGYFNCSVNSFDTSNVTTMIGMFGGTKFNNGFAPGVSGTMSWNTTKVTDMSYMFSTAASFNQDISSWDTANVTTMRSMFTDARLFNQNIGSWVTTKVTNMVDMFRMISTGVTPLFNNGFSPGVGGTMSWDTANVTDMSFMFYQCGSLNQNINFNFTKVQSMSNMFYGATSYNNGLASGVGGTMSWTTTGAVLTMDNLFNGANSFNQNLNSLNTTNVANMSQMFNSAVKFNNGLALGVSGIMTLNTAKVTSMSSMFQSASSFNQDISSWVTNLVGIMSNMFQAATSFDQNIGSWNVSNVTSFTSFMVGKSPSTFSAANLDAIYNGWSTRPVKPGVSISFGTAKYTSGSSAGRAILTTAPNNWVIADGGI